MPRDQYPQYEAIKESLQKRGKSQRESKRIAAATTNKRGGKVPPAHPKAERRRP